MSTVPSIPAGLSRRSLIGATLGGAAVLAAGCTGGNTRSAAKATSSDGDDPTWRITKGRIHQSVVGWCFNPMETAVLAKASAQLGFKSVELVDPKHWPMLKELGLTCAIAGSHGFVQGFNHVKHHAMCIQKISERIEQAAAFGCPNVITFSGMREGISDEEGIRNCVAGIKQVVGLAEQKGVTICMEVLNSRVNENMKGHPDYQADRIEFAVEICKQVGSPRMKILFDIYHTQIMQGDVITRIRQYHEYIGHYHTAGVPGRGELDDTQEINYPAVMKAIVATGYTGFVGQEFIPTWPDKIKALRHAARVCDV
jgi:hydroxypyruvate isomerase